MAQALTPSPATARMAPLRAFVKELRGGRNSPPKPRTILRRPNFPISPPFLASPRESPTRPRPLAAARRAGSLHLSHLKKRPRPRTGERLPYRSSCASLSGNRTPGRPRRLPVCHASRLERPPVGRPFVPGGSVAKTLRNLSRSAPVRSRSPSVWPGTTSEPRGFSPGLQC